MAYNPNGPNSADDQMRVKRRMVAPPAAPIPMQPGPAPGQQPSLHVDFANTAPMSQGIRRRGKTSGY